MYVLTFIYRANVRWTRPMSTKSSEFILSFKVSSSSLTLLKKISSVKIADNAYQMVIHFHADVNQVLLVKDVNYVIHARQIRKSHIFKNTYLLNL